MALRKPGKLAVNWILLGFILLGLGGFGVHSFTSQPDGSIGSVGGVPISTNQYLNAVQQASAQFQASTGAPPPPELKAQLRQATQRNLVVTAALQAEAGDIGLSVGDARVAEQIRANRDFRGPTGFDRAYYDQWLRARGLSERRYEETARMEEAAQLQYLATVAATAAPQGAVAALTRFRTEIRDLSWSEVTEDALTEPVAAPDEATLQAWHQANAARFTRPETRRISYAWLTPEMLQDNVQLDEAALRAAYDEHRDEFQQPARRMIDRLIYPDEAAAVAAKARLDAGTATFDQLVGERGLDRAAIDLGEVTEAELGAAGPTVFAAANNGVVGPVQTEVGPALISVNAIMDPVDISFEEAQADLRTEAAADKARRDIEALSGQVSDLLAGGATLADLARDTPMQTGNIDWQADAAPDAGSIAGYPEFRSTAAELTEGAFPEVRSLGDGGIFVAILDGISPPELIPFDQIRDQVLTDWTEAETHKRLLALADQHRLAAIEARAQPQANRAASLGRDSAIDGVPAEVVARAFDLPAEGDSTVVDAAGRVFLVTVDRIADQDPAAPETLAVANAVRQQMTRSLGEDYFAYYADAVIRDHRVKMNQSAIAAADAQLP